MSDEKARVVYVPCSGDDCDRTHLAELKPDTLLGSNSVVICIACGCTFEFSIFVSGNGTDVAIGTRLLATKEQIIGSLKRTSNLRCN